MRVSVSRLARRMSHPPADYALLIVREPLAHRRPLVAARAQLGEPPAVPGDDLLVEEGQRREDDHGDEAPERPVLDQALPLLLGPLPRRELGMGTQPALPYACGAISPTAA